MIKLISIEEFKKKAKTRYILNIVLISLLLIFSITGTVLSLLFSTLDYMPNLIINIAVSVVVVLFLIFYFYNIFPIVKHYYSYYKNLNNVSLETRRRMVYLKEIDKKEINCVTYRVMQFIYYEGETSFNEDLYVLDSDVEFVHGKPYKLDTYQNVIISYEELGHADVQ